MGIIFTISHNISKERCNARWGGAKPFLANLLSPNPTTFPHSIHLVQNFWGLVPKCFWNAKILLADL
jgi:hypothetical protein